MRVVELLGLVVELLLGLLLPGVLAYVGDRFVDCAHAHHNIHIEVWHVVAGVSALQ